MKKYAFSFLLIGMVMLLGRQSHAQVIIVANASVKASGFSKSDLKDVFNGTSTTLGGARVSIALLKGGAAHEVFLNEYVGKSDSYRATWRSLVFSGQASMPRTFESESALIEFVAATPGAIGYVSKSANHEKVRVLSVR